MPKLSNKKRLFLSVIIFNLFIACLVILVQKFLPPVVPILYGKPRSRAQLLPKIYLVIPPMVAIAITSFNFALDNILKNDFLQKIVLALAITVTALTTITTIRIISLVGNLI